METDASPVHTACAGATSAAARGGWRARRSWWPGRGCARPRRRCPGASRGRGAQAPHPGPPGGCAAPRGGGPPQRRQPRRREPHRRRKAARRGAARAAVGRGPTRSATRAPARKTRGGDTRSAIGADPARPRRRAGTAADPRPCARRPRGVRGCRRQGPASPECGLLRGRRRSAPACAADVRDLLVDPVARIARRDDLLQPVGPPLALLRGHRQRGVDRVGQLLHVERVDDSEYSPSSSCAPVFSPRIETPLRSLTSGPSLATRFMPSNIALTIITS